MNRPTPIVLDEGDVGSVGRYVVEKQDHGFSFASPNKTAEHRLLDSQLQQREAAEEPDDFDDIQPSPVPTRPVYNPGDQSLDELNRIRAHKVMKRGQRLGVLAEDSVPLIDPGNMPETKIGGMETSPGEYSGDGAAEMY